MFYSILLLGIAFFLNTAEAASTNVLKESKFRERLRQEVNTSKMTRSPDVSLPPIDTRSEASTEVLSPFSSVNSTPISSASSTPVSSIRGIISTDESTEYKRRPLTNNEYFIKYPVKPTTSARLKSNSNRRGAVNITSPALNPNDQYLTAQAYLYVSKIQDTQIRREAETFVGAAKTSQDKKELALAWLEYLSKIESVADRNEAANEVQNAPAEDKQCEARLWLEFFTRIPAGSIRNKAIADVNDERTHESKELAAKIWVEFLSQITDEKVQNRAASAVRRVSFHSKEQLAQEWLRLSKTNALDFVERTSPPAQKTTSWWKVLSEIKNIEIKNEARGYIENEITDRNDKMTMARIWVQYLSKILDESQRKAAIKAVMQASVNQWEDIASHYHAQYKGWA